MSDTDTDTNKNVRDFMTKIRLIILKKYLINFIAERYYSRMHTYLIFIPIQILAVWATLSSPLFMLVTDYKDNDVPDSLVLYDDVALAEVFTNITTEDIIADDLQEEAIKKHLDLWRTLADTLVGAVLLIITNLGKALQYERKSEQHKIVADEMKKVLDDINYLLRILPDNDSSLSEDMKDKNTKIRDYIEAAFEKSKDARSALSPPQSLVMAFENIECDMNLLMTGVGTREEMGKKEDTDGDKNSRSLRYVRKIKDEVYHVDNETRSEMLYDGYTDLADIMTAGISGCCFWRMMSSEKATAKTRKGLVEELESFCENPSVEPKKKGADAIFGWFGYERIKAENAEAKHTNTGGIDESEKV